LTIVHDWSCETAPGSGTRLSGAEKQKTLRILADRTGTKMDLQTVTEVYRAVIDTLVERIGREFVKEGVDECDPPRVVGLVQHVHPNLVNHITLFLLYCTLVLRLLLREVFPGHTLALWLCGRGASG
jgi:hypothetical protein